MFDIKFRLTKKGEEIFRKKCDLKNNASKYGFNPDYILEDSRVKHSTTDDYLDNIKSAIITYVEWQLDVIQHYGNIYTTDTCQGVATNLRQQINALKSFQADWEKIENEEAIAEIHFKESQKKIEKNK